MKHHEVKKPRAQQQYSSILTVCYCNTLLPCVAFISLSLSLSGLSDTAVAKFNTLTLKGTVCGFYSNPVALQQLLFLFTINRHLLCSSPDVCTVMLKSAYGQVASDLCLSVN